MDTERLKEIIELMDANNLVEVEIEEEGKKIKLKKASSHLQIIPQTMAHNLPVNAPIDNQKTTEETPSNLKEIKAPMVGTFYRSPAPNADPYVEIGKRIKKGDVICIIEAMKLMNEIKSEIEGEIVEILVENGEAVEFSQPLVRIKP